MNVLVELGNTLGGLERLGKSRRDAGETSRRHGYAGSQDPGP